MSRTRSGLVVLLLLAALCCQHATAQSSQTLMLYNLGLVPSDPSALVVNTTQFYATVCIRDATVNPSDCAQTTTTPVFTVPETGSISPPSVVYSNPSAVLTPYNFDVYVYRVADAVLAPDQLVAFLHRENSVMVWGQTDEFGGSATPSAMPQSIAPSPTAGAASTTTWTSTISYNIQIACTSDHYGPFCNISCSPAITCSGSGSCVSETGACACDSGTYGSDCSMTCTCVHGTCDETSLDGSCVAGSCEAGFEGPLCDQEMVTSSSTDSQSSTVAEEPSTTTFVASETPSAEVSSTELLSNTPSVTPDYSSNTPSVTPDYSSHTPSVTPEFTMPTDIVSSQSVVSMPGPSQAVSSSDLASDTTTAQESEPVSSTALEAASSTSVEAQTAAASSPAGTTSAPSHSTGAPAPDSGSSSSSLGAIIGAVVGGVFGILLIVFVVVCLCRGRHTGVRWGSVRKHPASRDVEMAARSNSSTSILTSVNGNGSGNGTLSETRVASSGIEEVNASRNGTAKRTLRGSGSIGAKSTLTRAFAASAAAGGTRGHQASTGTLSAASGSAMLSPAAREIEAAGGARITLPAGLQELLYDSNDIALRGEIGTCQFGRIFHADPAIVASSTTDTSKEPPRKAALLLSGYSTPVLLVQKLLEDVAVLSKCDHENIVRISAIWLPPHLPLSAAVIFERSPFGNLRQVLHRLAATSSNPAACIQPELEPDTAAGGARPSALAAFGSAQDPLKWPTPLSPALVTHIALQITEALAHLSSRGLVHGRLSCRAVHVFSYSTVKLGMVEMDPVVPGDQETAAGMVLLRTKIPTSPAGDVWRFGYLLHELVTCGELGTFGGCPSDATVVGMLLPGRTSPLQRPPHCSTEIFAMMTDCLALGSPEQPTFAHLANTLRRLDKPSLSAENSMVSIC